MRLLLALALAALQGCLSTAPPEREVVSRLVHVVAFTLEEGGAEGRDGALELVRDLSRDLAPIPGIVRLHAGIRDPRFTRASNLQDFDVLLIVEFTDKDAHDAYLVDPRHRAVVDAWTPRLRGIRVLDAAR